MKKTIYISLISMFLISLAGCRQGSGIVWEKAVKSETEDWSDTEQTDWQTEPDQKEQPEEPVKKATIMVDICGAVAYPGVYELQEGARVCDAVALAGGLLESADRRSLNQAAVLQDADKVVVYSKEEVTAMQTVFSGEADSSAAGQDAKVNINTADEAQLCTLSGIGSTRAKDIIAYRTMNGTFQTIEDIMNVSGIKEATFLKIKDKISVG